MTPFLAQLSLESVPPLIQFLIGGSAALFLINQAITFWKEHMREKPAPADTYTTLEQHRELKGRVDKIADDIKAGFERLDHKRSQSVAGLHDDLREAISELRSEVKDDLGGVQSKLSDVLAAVSELRGRVNESISRR